MLLIPVRGEVRAHPFESERLYYTPVEPIDGADIWQAVDLSRETLKLWLPWVAFTIDLPSTTRFAEACALDWDQGKAVRFSIRDKGTRAFLGVVGLESCVHVHRAVELGYWLRSDAQHHGFMSEAVRFALQLSFRHMGVHRIRVAAATDNHASLRVIQRAGLRFEGIARQAEWCNDRWLDHAVFAMLSGDVAPA